jgi:hypothetical protein
VIRSSKIKREREKKGGRHTGEKLEKEKERIKSEYKGHEQIERS